jgi:hypothetical protein
MKSACVGSVRTCQRSDPPWQSPCVNWYVVFNSVISLKVRGAAGVKLMYAKSLAVFVSLQIDSNAAGPTRGRMIDWKGSTQGLPAGAYTLLAYYQPCDGNCWMLDGEQPFCSTQNVLKANGRYHLMVRVNKHICEVSAW